jgi:SOS response regulatory protein OraA/RecX
MLNARRPTRDRRSAPGAPVEAPPVLPLTPALLERTALWHLGRKAMTTVEMRTVLQKKAARHPPHEESQTWIEALVARYTETQVLNDAQVSRDRIELGRGRGWSKRRIEQKLRGVDADVRSEAFADIDTREPDADGETGESAELTAARIFVAKKRLSEKPPEKALGALARQGFSYGVAKAALSPRGE